MHFLQSLSNPTVLKDPSQGYDQVPTTEDIGSPDHPTWYNRNWFPPRKFWGIIGLSSIIAIVLIIAVSFLRPNGLKFTKNHCGSSPDEARALGCHYELIGLRWVPDSCYDAELDEEFGNHGWPYFLDKNATKEVSKDVVKRGNEPVIFITWEQHLTHCAYSMRMLYRRYKEHRIDHTIPSYIRDEDHFNHCLGVLNHNPATMLPTDINTEVTVAYEEC
jgi:hypothetical protein